MLRIAGPSFSLREKCNSLSSHIFVERPAIGIDGWPRISADFIAYSAVQPPSMARIAPVIDLAASEARNTA